MAGNNSFSIEWLTKPFEDTMTDLARTTDRATMYALRKTGRAMASAARSKAPVYKGSDPRAKAESGNLKKSIKNARSLNRIGSGQYSLKVGPFGSTKKGTAAVRYGGAGGLKEITDARAGKTFSRAKGESSKGQVRGVPLYRSKMEAKYGFMAGALAEGDASFAKIYEDALAVGYEKYR